MEVFKRQVAGQVKYSDERSGLGITSTKMVTGVWTRWPRIENKERRRLSHSEDRSA